MNSKTKIKITKLLNILPLLFLGILIFFIAWAFYLVKDLPDYEKLKLYNSPKVTRIYTSDFCLIKEYGQEKRVYQPINDIPEIVVNAFIAAEDSKFFSHSGVQIRGIIQAFFGLMKQKLFPGDNKGQLFGRSTITQQVVKNLLLDRSKNIKRKAKEIVLAYLITKKFTKKEILELYLNHSYFGSGVYGVTEASRYYFNKRIQDLGVEEIAFLVGVLPSPARYTDEKNYKQAKFRRDYVLNRMAQEGYITDAQMRILSEKKLNIKKTVKHDNSICAPHVAERIREIVINKYGEEYFYTSGLTIVSTINSSYQKSAHESLVNGVKNYNTKLRLEAVKEANGAMFVMNYRTGQILAMSGGVDDSSFDRCIQAKRQIGSLAKSFVYFAALENGVPLNTVFVDEDIAIDQGGGKQLWSPRNFERNFLGKMTMRYAFEHSRNVVTVKLGMMIGLNKVFQLFERCGIPIKKSQMHLSVVLGALETSLHDIVRAYSVIANGGKIIDTHFIEYIQDDKGKLIYKRLDANYVCTDHNKVPKIANISKRVIDKATAYQMISLLEGSVLRGTSRSFYRYLGPYDGMLCGKTGTTLYDNWFVGFNHEIIAGAYVGCDIPQDLGRKATGASVSLPIVGSFFANSIKKDGNTMARIPVDREFTSKEADTIAEQGSILGG